MSRSDSEAGRPHFTVIYGVSRDCPEAQAYEGTINWVQVSTVEEMQEQSNNSPGYVVIFLQDDEFSSNTTLGLVVEYIDKNPHVGGFYADGFLKKTRQYFPSFTPGMFDAHTSIVDTPLFFKAALKPKFNPNLQHLFHYDIIRKIAKQIPVYHIAQPLMDTSKSNSFNFQYELSLIDTV